MQEGGVAVFRGIPYAAPPFGDLRFEAPAPHEPWTEERDCSAYGATVPKGPFRTEVSSLLVEPQIAGSECLNLNVWTPDPSTEGLPVLVWIHGGAFVNGSGAVPTYAGGAFARDGVVTVTLNYRLGVDGFAHLPDRPDNRGLLDQVAALRWVHDNIAAFGGDPGRVTIAGESAGAMSVTTLTAMPAARGLFQRVIAESGAGHHVLTPQTASLVTAALAERLGVEPTGEAIATVPVEDLVSTQLALTAAISGDQDRARWREISANGMPFEPVVDGVSVTGRPYDVVAAGDGAPVDLLIGSNDTEHTLFLYPLAPVVDEPLARMMLGAYGAPDDAYEILAADAATPYDVVVAGLTDWFFRVPAVRLAETRLAQGRDTFVYQFGWRTPVLDGVLGATHALEIGFAFDNLADPEGQWMTGPDAPQALADDMHAAWVRFVTDGDPGWPAYGEMRHTRRFGGPGDGTVLDDPDPQRRLLWPER
ncbi:carboxylic ester hydrolase [Marmoricola endophyticus]|uniref:Carboxylic ester hydrolase n=1 Tax=Marmoricola endophyticus TaxID=2040280 RepID=A0A917BWL6_9ACTN|nr:carboxylic ester hydrolase [Marmoricola endophyticus]